MSGHIYSDTETRRKLFKNVENHAICFVLILSVAGEYLYVHVLFSLCDAVCFRRMKAARAYLPRTGNKNNYFVEAKIPATFLVLCLHSFMLRCFFATCYHY